MITHPPATSIEEQLGHELEETPFGTQIRTEPTKETGVSGSLPAATTHVLPIQYR